MAGQTQTANRIVPRALARFLRVATPERARGTQKKETRVGRPTVVAEEDSQ